MKKLFALLSLVVLFSSCQRDTSLMMVKDYTLSSPNQPIYRLWMDEFRAYTRFNLMTEDSFGNAECWGDVWVDDFGDIVQYQDGCWKALTLSCIDYGPGEVLNVWLVYPNGQQAFRAHIVPHPFQITQYGYTFYLEKDDHLAHNWRFVGTGFEPGESLDVVVYASNTIHTNRLYANCEGEVIGCVDAWVEGKNTGTTRIEFNTWGGDLSFSFPWGSGWFEWKRQFVEEKRQQDKEYRHDLVWSTNYRKALGT